MAWLVQGKPSHQDWTTLARHPSKEEADRDVARRTKNAMLALPLRVVEATA